jgi:hypothetical protein
MGFNCSAYGPPSLRPQKRDADWVQAAIDPLLAEFLGELVNMALALAAEHAANDALLYAAGRQHARRVKGTSVSTTGRANQRRWRPKETRNGIMQSPCTSVTSRSNTDAAWIP